MRRHVRGQRSVALCLALVEHAEARDRFYYLGYEIIQVIDGDSDSIVPDSLPETCSE